MSTPDTLTHAIQYARDRGWPVFPVNSATKVPLIQKWQSRASTTLQALERWWGDSSESGIGIVTGVRSQLCVIDLDGPTALETLEKLGPIPLTLIADTSPGKAHLYFRSGNSNIFSLIGIFGDKIDVRCNNGFVVAPPSMHACGQPYKWRNPGTPVAEIPIWLEEKILFDHKPKKPKATKAQVPTSSQALPPGYADDIQAGHLAALRLSPEGTKHLALRAASMRIAGLVKRGWSDERTQTELMLKALEENASQPKDLENARRTITSAFAKATPENILNQAHTELDLALRVARDLSDFKYLGDMHRWHRFTGATWDEWPSPSLQIGELVQVMMTEPPAPDVEPAQHKKSLRRFRTAGALRGIASLAGECPEMFIKRKDMNKDPFLFNVQNGTIDLTTGQLRPHDPQDLLTLVSPYAFDPKATHHEWSNALDLYTGGDKELAQYLQRLIGSCLVRQVTEEQFWLFRGDGSNGKTAFLETVTAVMGPYAKPTTASSLIVRQTEQHTSAIGTLIDAGLAYVEELERGSTLDMDKVKRYFTGRSPVLVQLEMRSNWVPMIPTAKLIISSNHDPHFPDSSKGARRRFIVVPFDQVISKTVLRFTEKLLKDEAPGVLKWLVDGALEYIHHGLGTCKAVEQRTAQFHEDQDPLADFLVDCCVIDPSASAPFRALWLAYVDYCTQGHETPLTKKALGVLLTHKGFPITRTGRDSRKARAGLALTKDLAQQYQAKVMSS